MPRSRTRAAQTAEKKLRQIIRRRKGHAALPTVRELADELGVSYSTISRLMSGFVQEGLISQQPNSRFYPVWCQQKRSRGLPVVFIGRQVQAWSALYGEILSGVSAQCAESGCSLNLLSSSRLVEQTAASAEASIARLEVQILEARKLVQMIPRQNAGILLDHLWLPPVVETFRVICPHLRVLMRQEAAIPPAMPDYEEMAAIVTRRLTALNAKRIILAAPPETDANQMTAAIALRAALVKSSIESSEVNLGTKREVTCFLSSYASGTSSAIVMLEDNAAAHFHNALIQSKRINLKLFATQGTPAAPQCTGRIQFDFFTLGKAAATAVQSGSREAILIRPNVNRIPADSLHAGG